MNLIKSGLLKLEGIRMKNTTKSDKMTSDVMLKTKLPSGCFFHNTAKLGQKPKWIICECPAPGRFNKDEGII
jgi:hypothetical protein